jgi:hypothetical protein
MEQGAADRQSPTGVASQQLDWNLSVKPAVVHYHRSNIWRKCFSVSRFGDIEYFGIGERVCAEAPYYVTRRSNFL